MAGAPELPAGPLAPYPGRVEVVQPDPARSRLPRVGVVLAAGRSERLAAVTGGGSKALLRLGGLSLVERAVRSLLAAGLERVLVVVGHDAGPVATVVGRLGRDRVRVVYADRWAVGNGASLAAVQGEVLDEALFVLITADHVFGEGGLDRLLAAAAPAVLIDVAPDRPAWAEGTRVRVVDQAVVAFGKHLEEPAIDCGAFLLPLEVFERQRQAATEGDHSLAGAVTRLAQTQPLRPAPDLVSLVAFTFGLAGAALLAAGQGLAGALLVHASSVADGVDGEVARLQLRGGPRGALLDGLLDRVGDAAVLAGAGLWALDGHDARGVLVLTVAATTGALLSMASKDRAAALGLPPAPERALGWLLGGRDGRLLLVGRGRR